MRISDFSNVQTTSYFTLPKINATKVVQLVTAVAIAAIAVHMLTNLPGAQAADLTDAPGWGSTILSGLGSAGSAALKAFRQDSSTKAEITVNPTISPKVNGGGETIVNPTFNPVITVNPADREPTLVIPPASNSWGFSNAMLALSGVGTTLIGGAQVYPYYDAKDDVRLLRQIKMDDCGGLSNMDFETEGCYAQYLGKAIRRINDDPGYRQKMQNLFDNCFEDRPLYQCSWSGWLYSGSIYEAPQLDSKPRETK